MKTMKKITKKIVSLGIGAAMVGCTIMGAMAASLATYPAPFVQDGKFNGNIVIGDNAKPEDIIGAIDIISSLQYNMKSVQAVSVGTGSSTITIEGDSWKAETGSKSLEIGEDISNIQTKLTEANLNALADGSVRAKNTAGYEQEITIAGNIDLAYTEDTDNDKVGTFLTVGNDEDILAYKMTFKTALESDIDGTSLEDLDNSNIVILGKEYTISDTELSGKKLTLTLMGGAVTDILNEGATKIYTVNGKDYEVIVSYIGEDTAKLSVNGELTDAMEAGETDTVAGIDVGVREILAQNLAGETDKIEFSLGANKLVLYDSDITDSTSDGNLDIGDERMDSVSVGLKGTATASLMQLESIELNYVADDTFWIEKGKTLSEYVEEPEAFLNWDITFEGMSTATTEDIEIISSGDDKYILKATLADGEVSIPLAYSADATHLRLGDSNYALVQANSTINKNEYFILTTGNADDTEDKSYLLQYKGAESSTGDTTTTMKFKNLATGETFERTKTIGMAINGNLNLGGTEFIITPKTSDAAGTDDFNISVSGGAPLEESIARIVTEGDALITITDLNGMADDTWTTAADNILVNITEVDVSNMVESSVETPVQISIKAGDDIEMDSIVGLSLQSDPDDSKISTDMTTYGAIYTKTSVDSSPDKLKILWPVEQLVGQVFVTSGAIVSTTNIDENSIITEKITRIDVGAALLASEISGEEFSKNLILVGGPCANAATSVIMGNSENCAEGFEEGKAKIKLYTQTNGKVALVIAGNSALDTRAAAQYVAYSDKHADIFSKATNEIALTVTSLNNVIGSIPSTIVVPAPVVNTTTA